MAACVDPAVAGEQIASSLKVRLHTSCTAEGNDKDAVAAHVHVRVRTHTHTEEMSLHLGSPEVKLAKEDRVKKERKKCGRRMCNFAKEEEEHITRSYGDSQPRMRPLDNASEKQA